MAAIQPASKKRKIVAKSSKDEDDALFSGISKPPPQRHTLAGTRSATRTPSTTRPTSLPFSNALLISSSTASVRQSSLQGPRPNAKRSVESVSSPQKPTFEQARPNDSHFPSSPCTLPPQSQLNLPMASQHEDLEDLIEDNFSDNDALCPSAAIALSTSPSLLTLRGPTYSTMPRASTGAKTKSVAVNLRPWPERFAPKSPLDLAVHPKKVSEVRSWLEHVLDGFSKQRLLVLTGPAGTGKTATVNTLSKELSFEILEWKNPSGSVRRDAYGADGAFNTSLTGIFEEFVSRAGRFGSLEMVSTTSSSLTPNAPRYHSSNSDESERKKIILIEDFPNALFASSQAPLTSFRHAIKSFLAFTSPRFAPALPPLVLIISESAIASNPGAFTAHRLLSPEILHHPLSTTISFNKIAPTFMFKALSAIIAQESRESSRGFGPSKPLMEVLTSSGDVRSAIMSLEFLAVNGDDGTFTEPAISTKRKKKKLRDCKLNDLERQMLVGVTQRESQLGIFHAIGKVVHNKRYGDDVEDPYVPPPPKPLLGTHAWKKRASKVDINSLMDEAGADAQTLICGIHENYLGSCNFLGGFSPNTHSLQDLLDCACNCLTDLSDSDLLSSPRPYNTTQAARSGGSYEGFEGVSGTAGIRQDEIAFQVAVRGAILALPSPVKRATKDNKMFYPIILRLWRERQEIESLVDLFVKEFGLPSTECKGSGGVSGAGRSAMVLEQLPYLIRVLRGKHQKMSRSDTYGLNFWGMGFMRELERVTGFKGIRGQNEEMVDDDLAGVEGTLDDLEVIEEQRNGMASMKAGAKAKAKWGKQNTTQDRQWELEVEQLVLADDDIEHDW